MTYSLWRGGERLGDMVFRLPAEGPLLIAGLFRPTPVFSDIGPLMQHSIPMLPGNPVFIHRDSGEWKPGPYALEPLPPEEASGLPANEQLVLRDAEGEVVDVGFLSLSQEEFPPGPGEFPQVCRAHGFVDAAWVLCVRLNHLSPRRDSDEGG